MTRFRQLSCETKLVDGRNRRAACKIAGVIPDTRELNGEDATAYVLSANIHRRHMTKGQRAMAVAKIYPEPGRGRGKKDPAKETEKVSYSRIKVARYVLQYAPDIAPNVLNGLASLDDAYKAACERKKAATTEETKLADLGKRYPELADKVVEGELGIAAALVEAGERDAQERERRAVTECCFFEVGVTRESRRAPIWRCCRKLPNKWLLARGDGAIPA